jgi:hypothetical protein
MTNARTMHEQIYVVHFPQTHFWIVIFDFFKCNRTKTSKCPADKQFCDSVVVVFVSCDNMNTVAATGLPMQNSWHDHHQ